MPGKHDAVFRPDHYTRFKVEPVTFIMLNNLPYAEGNVIKYIMRWRYKNGMEDLLKARRMIDIIIEHEKRTTDGTATEKALSGEPL